MGSFFWYVMLPIGALLFAAEMLSGTHATATEVLAEDCLELTEVINANDSGKASSANWRTAKVVWLKKANGQIKGPLPVGKVDVYQQQGKLPHGIMIGTAEEGPWYPLS